jgi:hypothetical protein
MSNLKGKLLLPNLSAAGTGIGLNVFNPRTYANAFQTWREKRKSTAPKKEKVPFRQNKQLHKTLSSIAVGIVLFLVGCVLGTWQDQQNYLYDAGLQAYKLASAADEEDNPIQTPQDQAKAFVFAYKALDASMAVYKFRGGQGWLARFLYPKPDRHIAALASFQKGKILIRMQKAKEAVAALKGYLELNPAGSADAYTDDTIVVEYDLELLYQQNPQLQQQEGKGGKGKPGGKDGKGDKPAPDADPNAQPGHMPLTKM